MCVPAFLSKLIHTIDSAQIDSKGIEGFGWFKVPVYRKARRIGGNTDSGVTGAVGQ